MAQLMAGSGFAIQDDARKAEVIIVNTCGFIGPAKEESLQVLERWLRASAAASF